MPMQGPDRTTYDINALVSGVAAGDAAAFTVLYQEYYPRIYGLARHLTGSEASAEEIVQDVFLKVWLRQQALKEVQHFEAYLFVIARNHIYTYLRSMARRATGSADPLDQQPVSGYSPADSLELKEMNLLLAAAIGRLPAQQQEVYRLSKEQGLSREEIAERMHLSPETVKVHLARAMRAIRTYLAARLLLVLATCLGGAWQER
ncbi:MAG: RNA polymerase sigma-70 factor [Candidatus Pseudobacter hemicellulosilyticus]|uniref:RNA polymerase sigma factor n=1 Tax=Candidatus Pseudobacter hemicellulosilyticus TaxID=3121375 RepID=A0AAJ6BGD0_9BACT|nr:MAG: RNA polymerase sigma-70 factor [Pseudobacter sp.]